MQFAQEAEVELAVRECTFVHVRRDADEALSQRTLFCVRVASVIFTQDELLT